jgi:ketosteroid isomerase-like protein
MNETEKKILVENYIRAYNGFDIEGMLANLHENVTFKNVSAGDGAVTLETEGIEAFRNQARQAAGLFAEREQKIENIFFSRDGCEVDIDYRAKLAADLPNGAKAGDTISLKGKSFFRFAEGKIREIRDES